MRNKKEDSEADEPTANKGENHPLGSLYFVLYYTIRALTLNTNSTDSTDFTDFFALHSETV